MKKNEFAEDFEHVAAEEKHRQLHRYNNEVAELLEQKRKHRMQYVLLICLFFVINIVYSACSQ